MEPGLRQARAGALSGRFAPFHRGGAGPPLVCLHGFIDTWRTWELVLPALERRHDVLAVTLPGHAGGPPLPDPLTDVALVDAVERLLDAHGIERAHLVGNSLGGNLALRLAARGRALSVVALAPAGGWADDAYRDVLRLQSELVDAVEAAAPHADAIVASPEGRRRATLYTTVEFEHIPSELLAHQTRAVAASAPDARRLIAHALTAGAWELDAARVACPVRIVWGTEDRLLEWPRAAARYRTEWLPHADWVELDGVGHCPQLDVPLVTAELILGFTG